MTNAPKRILSGARPTGMLHLGNYHGSIKQFIDLQQENNNSELFYFIADLHALTTIDDNIYDINAASIDLAKGYLACGLDPNKTCIYRQSAIEKIPYLYSLLGMLTSESWLRKCTTYKEKSAKQKITSFGLLGYPVLMATDIIIMQADLVPVGEDQLQHLEMARDTALKFNKNFGEIFVLPETIKLKAIRVPALDGSGKMGKSDSNFIGLFEDPSIITKKVMAAVTDSGPTDPMSKELENIYFLLKLHSNKEEYERFYEMYQAKNTRFYGELKKSLANNIVNFLAPFSAKYKTIKDSEVLDILQAGAAKANKIADTTFNKAYKLLKL